MQDSDRWTSSGVMAGMDMVAALLAEIFGPQRVARAATELEAVPNQKADEWSMGRWKAVFLKMVRAGLGTLEGYPISCDAA